METPTFKNAQEAFRQAIKDQRLSDDPNSPTFAGKYMYMGTWAGTDHFKHYDTRSYDV